MRNSSERISATDARRIVLASQGLWTGNAFGTGIEGAARTLEHLGYVQIDTISVIERAHHHVFWSRVPDYRPDWLDRLVVEGKAFEYWSHAASYLPMRDFRFSLPRKRLYSSGQAHWFTMTDEHKKWRRRILAKVRREGAVSTRDFETPNRPKSSGWFERTPSKQMLEQLFMEGELMVSGRRGFEKFYDLPERVLPSNVDTRFPTQGERARHMIETALRAQGLLTVAQIAYLRKKPMRDQVATEARRLLREGALIEANVKGIAEPFLALAEDWTSLREAAALPATKRTHLLSPFDNLVIRRERLRDLFGFDYTIECYVPAPKRKFGYFTLPILAGDRFLGRLDSKADRADQRLLVKSWNWEVGVASIRAQALLKPILSEFAAFNGCATWTPPTPKVIAGKRGAKSLNRPLKNASF